MSMSYGDWFEQGMVSDCCSAGVYLNGICSACKDHCTPVTCTDEEEENKPIKKATVDSEKYNMEHFDDDVCDLFNKYLGVGFVSSSNEQFFNDKDIVTDFNYHLDGLKTLLQSTREDKNDRC